MCVILRTWCQIQRISASLRYVKCGPVHMQCNYSSAYPDFSIQLNVSALLMEISRQFNPRYTANLVPHTAHILQFTPCELWSRPYTNYLQLLIVRPQYSTEPDYAATTDMPTFGCSLYCNIGATYSAHPPVYSM
jgi:hypothetical protein